MEEIREEKIRDIDKLRRKLGSMIQASFSLREVDPFGGNAVAPSLPIQAVESEPSDKQVRFVLKLSRLMGEYGVHTFKTLKAMSKGKLRHLISYYTGSLKRQGVKV